LIVFCLYRILNKFLDNYQEDVLPWHESIEPCLSSMTAFINDREVSSQTRGRKLRPTHRSMAINLL